MTAAYLEIDHAITIGKIVYKISKDDSSQMYGNEEGLYLKKIFDEEWD